MGARRARVPAFVEGAIARLNAAAIEAGVPALGPGQANYQAHFHGVGGEPRCDLHPCRAAGLCHALWELIQHRGEAEGGRLRLDAVDRAGNARGAVRAFVEALGPVLHNVAEQHRHPFHDHAGCEQTMRVLPGAIRLIADLHQWESDMRGRFWSRELQQPKGKKPAELLLTAVCQHLHEVGGITYAEIARLVLGDATTGAGERIRKRVNDSPDAQSVKAYPVPRERRRNKPGDIPPADRSRARQQNAGDGTRNRRGRHR